MELLIKLKLELIIVPSSFQWASPSGLDDERFQYRMALCCLQEIRTSVQVIQNGMNEFNLNSLSGVQLEVLSDVSILHRLLPHCLWIMHYRQAVVSKTRGERRNEFQNFFQKKQLAGATAHCNWKMSTFCSTQRDHTRRYKEQWLDHAKLYSRFTFHASSL
jgi:hypothetical protein